MRIISAEVLASKILDCFTNKVDCVGYTGRSRKTPYGKLFVDKCRNFVGEQCSFVEAWEVLQYAKGQVRLLSQLVLGILRRWHPLHCWIISLGTRIGICGIMASGWIIRRGGCVG